MSDNSPNQNNKNNNVKIIRNNDTRKKKELCNTLNRILSKTKLNDNNDTKDNYN